MQRLHEMNSRKDISLSLETDLGRYQSRRVYEHFNERLEASRTSQLSSFNHFRSVATLPDISHFTTPILFFRKAVRQ